MGDGMKGNTIDAQAMEAMTTLMMVELLKEHCFENCLENCCIIHQTLPFIIYTR